MARIKRKDKNTFETDHVVEKFGAKVSKHANLAPSAEVQELEVKSKTNLEEDTGYGQAAIIRMFEFGMNVKTFLEVKPTKQQLFNSHYKVIETALWKDGLKVLPEVEPRVTIDAKGLKYRIFVGARPMRGHILQQVPKTLSQIAKNQ